MSNVYLRNTGAWSPEFGATIMTTIATGMVHATGDSNSFLCRLQQTVHIPLGDVQFRPLLRILSVMLVEACCAYFKFLSMFN